MKSLVPDSLDQHAGLLVLSIGHSTRPIGEFIRILHVHGVACVADVRSIPRSRHNPQFNRDVLPASLEAAGIGYEYMRGLGGLRRPLPDSINTYWENASFRGYADYMQTREFEDSLNALIDLATSKTTTIMCSESLPWRCHRSLIADALSVRGIYVEHIITVSRRSVHTLLPFANIRGTQITYPSAKT